MKANYFPLAAAWVFRLAEREGRMGEA